MRINSKQAIQAYANQSSSNLSSRTELEKERLLRQIKKTKEVLTGESDEESFAHVLEVAAKNDRTH